MGEGSGAGRSMRWDQTVLYGTERSVLRLRLAAAALASTLLLLSPRGDALPAVISVAYAIAAGALYTLGLHLRAPLLATIGAALDVAFPTALVVFAPDASLLWILYAFAIGISAIRRQAGGGVAGGPGGPPPPPPPRPPGPAPGP